jgi:hypothetical protein
MERRSYGRILASMLTMTAAAGLPLALVTVGALSSTASAQVLRVSPWHAVVNVDEALLRCGNGDLMYPVATLRRGQVLRVDGEGQGWARVSYPAGTAAFVPADSIQVDLATRTATLTKPSRLKAANLTTGLRGSWKDVLDQPLPAGTRLRVLDAEPTSDGRGNSAWRITPPEGTHAFIPLSVLRRATEEEVQQAAAMAPSAVAPLPVAQQQTPAPSGGATPATTVERWPAAPGSGANLADPIAPPASGSGSVPSAPGAMTTAAGEQPVAPVVVVLPPSPYERLEAAFEAVRQDNPDTAEFSELLVEFQRALAQLDDSPQSQALRGRIQQRINFLKLRADLQGQRRALEAAQANLSTQDQAITEKLAEVDRTRQYTVVGRLSASTIYNGERLPLMYRIQSIGGTNPRTLAYIRPSDSMNIESRLGQVVGVLGDSSLDSALRLNIITPLRIDVLEAATTAVVQPDRP